MTPRRTGRESEGLDADLRPRVPAGPELAVGDRVEVRCSGECRGRLWRPLYPEISSRESLVAHFDWEDGCIGTISMIDSGFLPQGRTGHAYFVKMDTPMGDRWLPFARSELARLSPTGQGFALPRGSGGGDAP